MKLGTPPILKLLILTVVIMAPLMSNASLIVTPGNQPLPNEQNVLFTPNQAGNTVNGLTDITHSMVSFSAPVMLSTTGNGVSPAQTSDVIHDLTITAAGTFTDLILNPQVPNGPGGGPWDLTILLNTNAGQLSYTFPTSGSGALGNGNNFITFEVTGGILISSVELLSTSGFDGLTQTRISGLQAVNAPEPASLLLLGAGLSALSFRRRRLS